MKTLTGSDSRSLKHQTVDGIKWQVAISLLQKVITFGTTMILARRLGPSVYGLFAFSLVVVSSFELFKSMGIDAALVRRNADFEKAANTAFLIIPLLGISLYILLWFLAPLIGNMLGNTEMVSIVRILGVIFVISCFAKIPVITLERGMRFKSISLAEVSGTVVFAGSAVTFVFFGFGIWTLVYAYILRLATTMAIVWAYSGWKPSFTFDRKLAWELFHFGKYVFLTSVLWFLKANLDTLLVGKVLGTTMLGYYAVAFSVANFGADYFGGRVYRVIFPAYSRIHSDTERLRKAFLKVLRYVSIIALPLGIGTFMLGGEFVQWGYGGKWTASIGVLKILSWLAITNLIIVTTDSIFMAIGKSRLSFYSILLQVAVFFSFIVPMAKWFGLPGVGAVVTGGAFLAMALQFTWVMKQLSLSLREVGAVVYAPLASAMVMAVALMLMSAVSSALVLHLPYSLGFFAKLIAAALSYISALALINRPMLKEMRELVFSSSPT